MNKYTLIPSNLRYNNAPSTNQDIILNLDAQNQELIEYDRSATISLAQLYDDERQSSTIFRTTFKLNYLYANTISGTTEYTPFKNNLYYLDPINSKQSGIWKGYPQYYEFDFFRPPVNDQHFVYKSKSAYTYNWVYYISYPSENDGEKKLSYTSQVFGTTIWKAKDGIPFMLKNTRYYGSPVIEFLCYVPHGLAVGEYVELSFKYNNKNLFQVYTLGNGLTDSQEYIFTIYNPGFTGDTFKDYTKGILKRVVNPSNISETKSKYYIRKHKIITDVNDIIVTKNGFEKNYLQEERQLEYGPITPDGITRISQKTSSNSYNFTMARDIDINGLIDNQKRPVSELFLTVVHKGYSGFFNPKNTNSNVALKQGWRFNITSSPNPWWSPDNSLSNTNISTTSYTKYQNDVPFVFNYNSDLNKGDTIDGAFCEWNDYLQEERVISEFYHKIKYNEDVFQTVPFNVKNANGYYYQPHHKMQIRVFSDYVEVGNADEVENIPSYAFYSQSDQQFRWRDLYSYGFVDSTLRGVDYPYFNNAHYPFSSNIFRLIPEGSNYITQGIPISIKPIIDDCE